MHTSRQRRVPVHVEVRRVTPGHAADGGCENDSPTDEQIRQHVHALIATLPIIADGVVDFSAFEGLVGLVESVRITGLSDRTACGHSQDGPLPSDGTGGLNNASGSRASWNGNGCARELPFWKVLPSVHVYTCRDDATSRGLGTGETKANAGSDTGWEDVFGVSNVDKVEQQPGLFSVNCLPSRHIESLWESLIMECEIKQYLLEYITSGCLFSQRNVDSRLISWNRVALLHGPPGSGKTSLSRALAHKLAIRLDVSNAKLIEIHANNLFSKWFSESSRNVGYIFENVREMASDRDCGLLVVMIDEVESLSASRAASAASAEPSDALRVVNALLTAIDTLRELPNVLVIATSNLTERIDSAFLDRADIKQYIGLPSLGARYEILRGGVCELIKCGIVSAFGSKDDANKLPFDALSITLSDQSEPPTFGQWREFDKLLHRAAVCADGLSGRSLRKLCLLAHARLPYSESSHLVPIDVFLRALGRAASSEASLRGLDSGAPT